MATCANRTSSPSSADDASEAPRAGAPLDSDSLTWRYLADVRGVLLALRAGVLQVMHPSISTALIDHSDVFENPLARLIRSAGPILGAVYDEDAEATARWIRECHPSIRGRDPHGHRYHALDPGTYYWAHATFFEAQIATQELFGVPFTDAEKQQLYAESITWYARYGLTMRPVPRDYEAFERYWQEMLDDVLEATPVALDAVQTMSQLAGALSAHRRARVGHRATADRLQRALACARHVAAAGTRDTRDRLEPHRRADATNTPHADPHSVADPALVVAALAARSARAPVAPRQRNCIRMACRPVLVTYERRSATRHPAPSPPAPAPSLGAVDL